MKNNIAKGIIQMVFIACLGYLATFLPFHFGLVTNALVLGIVFGNVLKPNSSLSPGIQFSEKKILSVAIVLLGLQLNGNIISELSWQLILFIPLVMVATILLSTFLAKYFNLSKKLGALIGMGNAVCGTSAIMAASATLSPDSKDTGVAVGTINLLGTLALFAIPAFSTTLGLSESTGGILAGGTLQAVGHAVAAGTAIGPEAEVLATTVKMGRVAFLAPMLFLLIAMFGKSEKNQPKGNNIPWFIWGFLTLVIITNVFSIPENLLSAIQSIQKMLLAIAMAAIGFKIQFKELLSTGTKALWLGLIIFIFQASLITTFVMLF